MMMVAKYNLNTHETKYKLTNLVMGFEEKGKMRSWSVSSNHAEP